MGPRHLRHIRPSRPLSTRYDRCDAEGDRNVQSGQLNNGANAVTVITCPQGSGSSIAFGCDNGLQGMAPAVLRVAIYDTEWHLTQPVTVDSAKGQTVIPFTNPAKTGVISVRRQDAGEVVVGWEIS